jgi:hypothetical protein
MSWPFDVATVVIRWRWACLLAGYVVVAKVCSLLHIQLPMKSFFRPHNLIKYSPHKPNRAFVEIRFRQQP